MLRWAIAFFLVALLASIFGYSDVATGAAWAGRMLCFIFLSAFVIGFASGLIKVRRGRFIIARLHRKT